MGNGESFTNENWTQNEPYPTDQLSKLKTVDDIPAGASPPGVSEIVAETKRLACEVLKRRNPTDIAVCRTSVCRYNRDSGYNGDGGGGGVDDRAIRLSEALASFNQNDPPYTEKTYAFRSENSPEVWITSSKNNDGTISYWTQYPIQLIHIQTALLKLMNVQVTRNNIADITERYAGVVTHVYTMLHKDIVKCDQSDPLELNLVIRSLFNRNYKAFEQK